MKNKLAATFLILTLVSTATAHVKSSNRKPTNVTGQYRFRKAEFRNRLDVKQLPGGRIKFHLVALWISPNYPDNIHNGEIHGEVKLEKGVAFFSSEECTITMKFTLNKVVVTESTANPPCGFGVNVTANGSYRKVDNRNPKFDF